MANGLVGSNFHKIMVITAMIGTDKNAPIIPHKLDQNKSDKIIMVDDKFNLLPIILGSKKFHEII